MPFRFWCRFRLAPGVTLNLSKSTASLSLGPRGAKYTISPRGNRATAGLPSTGLFYTVHDRKRAGRGGAAPAPKVPQRDRLKLSFFQRLMTPAEERRFIDGIRALNEENTQSALSALEEARELPDAASMAGMIRLRREELDRAKAHFRHALERLDDLGVLPDAAIDAFTLANRRRKDQPEALLHQIRYDRAMLYFDTGQRARARREFENLYAADPGLNDVAERLGFGA